MSLERDRKPKVSTEFLGPDGAIHTRSHFVDFQTLRSRIFARIRDAVGDEEGNRQVIPGVNAYNSADYEAALDYFLEAVVRHAVLNDELRPHVLISKRVINSILTLEDIEYRDSLTRWERRSWLGRYYQKAPIYKARCKYCGHYTRYIHPEEGLAYLGTNNCDLCGRGYPVPDFAWDGLDGQAYIYYRNSVTEDEFYREFEEQYEVHPDHTHFLVSNPVKSNTAPQRTAYDGR